MNLFPLQNAAGGAKVVLAHDWLTGMRGGERVLEILCAAFPSAPLVTLLANPASVCETIRNREIITSPLQHIPGIARNYRKFLPLMPAAAAATKVPDADIIISSSHCVAKYFKPKGAKSLCYCFTPMRYAWLFQKEYLGAVKAAAAEPLFSALRHWDKKTSARVDRFVGISNHVRERIERFYGRDAGVVYPPCDTERFFAADFSAGKSDYDLIVSALVPYKRIDIAVEAYRRTGRKLVIIGSGSTKLTALAQNAPNVQFLGHLSDAEITEYYHNCRYLIFPGEEDYGIVPVEAMACGKPVIAFGRGGATETVLDGVSGVLFPEQTPESLISALARAETIPWNAAEIRARAQLFDNQQFIDNLAAEIRLLLTGAKNFG